MQHLNPDKAVDDMLRDFFGGRLPPFEKGVKKGEFTINILDYDRVVPLSLSPSSETQKNLQEKMAARDVLALRILCTWPICLLGFFRVCSLDRLSERGTSRGLYLFATFPQ